MVDPTFVLEEIYRLTTFFGTFIGIILAILASFVAILAFLLWRHNELRKRAENEVYLLKEMRKKSEEDAREISRIVKLVSDIALKMSKEEKIAVKNRKDWEKISKQALAVYEARNRRRVSATYSPAVVEEALKRAQERI